MKRSSLASSMAQENFTAARPRNLFVDLKNLFSKVRNLNEVTKWRIAAFTFVSSILAFSSKLDMIMIRVWSYLQNGTDLLPRMFRHDHWEWGVAVWAFFFWIHGFWLADRAVAKADAKGIVHPWKKYRLQDQYEGEKFRRMQLRKLEQGEEVDRDAKPPAVKQHKWHLGFWIFELPLYCVPLYIWDVCLPRRAAKIAAWGAPTALGVCKDVTCALLLYDFGFFICHYLMHKVPFLYKYVHAKHHTSTEVRASDIVRLSFVEEIVDVGISILALNYLRCHPISRTLYNIIITFMLTELHSGFAFPWTPQFVVPFGLATGSKGHHYHHRNGEHYYQKFFCHVDRLFGFVQKKDDTLKGYSVS
jgi:sterol desaturase/sphingolipid hydroxylase (fatty acid hydroxylase superfamily)